jgi:D-alanine-D-alanine ligase
MKSINIAIFFGGRSSEHEISIRSAGFIHRSLDRSRYQVRSVYIDRAGRFFLVDEVNELPSTVDGILAIAKTPILLMPGEAAPIRTLSGEVIPVDAVFPVLHGPNGEDGTLQGLLRMLDLAFVGCDVLSSALCMDKAMMKPVLAANGIDSARYILVEKNRRNIEADEVFNELGDCVFVKPARQGSSVGVNRATSRDELQTALDEAFRFDSKVLIEEAIVGREIECSVLGNEKPEASVPGEILPQHAFYSYEAKYVDPDGARLQIPADLTPYDRKRICETAIRTYRALDCEGLARVDVFFTPDGRILVNEINTMPGFTQISMYPKMWEATGLPSRTLMDRLVEAALARHKERSSFQITRF